MREAYRPPRYTYASYYTLYTLLRQRIHLRARICALRCPPVAPELCAVSSLTRMGAASDFRVVVGSSISSTLLVTSYRSP